MTTAKNTQTTPAGLPDAPWFTLDEVAERWGCKPEYVEKFAKTGQLRVSIETTELVFNRMHTTKYGDVLTEYEDVFNLDEPIIELPEPLPKPKTYTLPAGIYVLPAGTVYNAISLGKTTLGYLESTEAPDEFYRLAPQQSVWVHKDKLLVRKDELNAFEQKHRIGAYAGTMPEPNQITKWPWGSYETKLLSQLAEAAEKFWTLYDPSEPSTAPTNEQVEEFLREIGVSVGLAAKMATILRADGLPSGPRKG